MLRLLVVLATAFAITIVVACGGDDDGDADAGQPTPKASSDAGDGDGGADGDDGGAGDAPGDVDPCALVTQEEAAGALGEQVGPGMRADYDPFVSCIYETDRFDKVDVTVLTSSRAEVETLFELSRENFEDVDGLGEAAYWAESPFNNIEVLQGNYDLSITVFGTAEDFDAKTAAIDLAAKAVDRLP